jgi:hypothetical protein
MDIEIYAIPIIEMINDRITQDLTRSVCDQGNFRESPYPVMFEDGFMGYDALGRMVINNIPGIVK